MKFSLFSIISLLVLFASPCSSAGGEPVAVPAQAVHINWYEIPPDIRRYLTVSRYFTPEAQVFISMMIIRETDLQRVMMQASRAGKSRQEAMQTAVGTCAMKQSSNSEFRNF